MKAIQNNRREPEGSFVKEAVGSWPNVSPMKGKWVDPRTISNQNINPNIHHNIQHHGNESDSMRLRSCSLPLKDDLPAFMEPESTFAMYDPMEELEKELFSPSPIFDFSPASNPMCNNNVNNSVVSSPIMFNQIIPAAPPVPPSRNNVNNNNNTKSLHVSPTIADKHKKLEMYRQKRAAKRTSLSRSSDTNKRSQAASQRPRDEFGHFAKVNGTENVKAESKPPSPPVQFPIPSANSSIHDVISLLYESKRESFELKNKLALVFDEMLSLREKAQKASEAKEKIKQELENQQKINNMLLQQNKLLWQTVPQKEVFNTINGGMPFVQPFKDKVDLTKIDLHSTNSPHLEAAKDEDENFGKRWEAMSFLMGVIHPPVTQQIQDNSFKP